MMNANSLTNKAVSAISPKTDDVSLLLLYSIDGNRVRIRTDLQQKE